MGRCLNGSSDIRLNPKRETLKGLEENFDTYISPFLDNDDPEDVNIAWEFRKYLHSKRLRMLTAERDGLKRWKEALLSR